jgi:hypothetical protein
VCHSRSSSILPVNRSLEYKQHLFVEGGDPWAVRVYVYVYVPGCCVQPFASLFLFLSWDQLDKRARSLSFLPFLPLPLCVFVSLCDCQKRSGGASLLIWAACGVFVRRPIELPPPPPPDAGPAVRRPATVVDDGRKRSWR